MFRCPTIDERVFAASLHHPTRRDGLRVPFPCDWHAQLPSAAGTLSLSLVVRSFFFFFLFLFGSLSFVSSIACRSCSLSPFILAPRIPWLRCLVRVRISPSCDVLSVFAPQLLHVWVSVVSRGGATPLPPSCFLFFSSFFYDGDGVEPDWDTHGMGSVQPTRPSVSFTFSFSFSPSLAMPIGLSLSLPSSSHTRPSPIDDGDHPSTRKGRRPGEGRRVEGNKVHRIHTRTSMGWHHWTWTMLWITWMKGTWERYVHAKPHEGVGREETTHQRTKRIARVRWYHGNPHHPIPWEKKETENETNPRRPVHTREVEFETNRTERRQGPSHASNKRNETRTTRVHGSVATTKTFPNASKESKRTKAKLTCDVDPRDHSTTSIDTHTRADRPRAKARQAEGANARRDIDNQNEEMCRRITKERRN